MIYLYFFIVLLFINLIGLFLMFLDKRKAKNNQYRISEKTLFFTALFLGGIGVHLGMYKFRHKTKHWYFIVGIPLCIIINVFTIYYIFRYNLLNYIYLT